MCGRGGTRRSNVAKPHALRLVEDDTAALRNGWFMGRGFETVDLLSPALSSCWGGEGENGAR